MVVTVEELKRPEETDIRDLRREDLDNAEVVEKIYVYDDKRVQVVLRHQNQFIKVAMLCDFLKHSEAEGKAV